MKKNARLTLIPTPIDDTSPLEPIALEVLMAACQDENSLILVEELKVCRRRWLRWGLPREAIEKFIEYNEHSRDNSLDSLVKQLRSGKRAYLMSDCGLPAFCDPGQLLVNACHARGLIVTSTPFPNSIALAVALSGFKHERFVFEGFLPRESSVRKQKLAQLAKSSSLSIVMDTPYRLQKLMIELEEQFESNYEFFLGLNLNQEEELLLRGNIKEIKKKLPSGKHEFILLLNGRN